MAVRPRRGGGDFSERGITTLVIDHAAVAALFLPEGQVFRWGKRLGEEVEVAAKAHLFWRHGEDTGALKRSIGSSVTPTGNSFNVSVRATDHKALWIHEGTRAHRIEPTDPNGKLHFFWIKQGRFFKGHVGQGIHHPGTRAIPFLRDGMHEVLHRHHIGV